METFTITIDKRTPSVNHLYGHTKFGAFYLKPQAKVLKHQIIESAKSQLAKQGYDSNMWKYRLLRVHTKIYESWWTLKNTVKKKDIANREKFLIDSIMEGLELDDSYVWEHILTKVDSDVEKAEITLSFYSV